MKYQKKPVVIEAVKASEVLDSDIPATASSLPEWLRTAAAGGVVSLTADYVYVRTLEGVMRANRDDYIICGVKGELYPCKPDIFAATYEPVG